MKKIMIIITSIILFAPAIFLGAILTVLKLLWRIIPTLAWQLSDDWEDDVIDWHYNLTEEEFKN